MNVKEKDFDCVGFKHKLHRNAYALSGAKTIREYNNHVNSEIKERSMKVNYRIHTDAIKEEAAAPVLT